MSHQGFDGRRALAPGRGTAIWAAGLIALLVPAAARAQASFTLIPRFGVGTTNNPTATTATTTTTPHGWDEFVIGSVNARVNYLGVKSDQGLGYRLSYTRFFNATEADTLGNEASYLIHYHFTGAWTLELSADAILTKTSRILTTGDLGTGAPQAAAGGASLYFSGHASESLAYTPKPTQSYRETLRAEYLDYLETAAGPTTLAVEGRLDADWLFGKNTYTGEAQVTGSHTSSSMVGFPSGTVYLAGGMAGWHRQLSASWNSVLRAGGEVITGVGLTTVEPVGAASIEYHHVPWFATLSASQLVAPNLYTGGVTVNDQALVSGAIPLDRRELILLSGNASYTRARAVGGLGALTSSFDQWGAVAALTGHHPRIPVYMSLEYTFVDQTNRSSATATTTPVPDLLRHTVLLSIGGAFVWGPGTPPIIQGGLI